MEKYCEFKLLIVLFTKKIICCKVFVHFLSSIDFTTIKCFFYWHNDINKVIA